MNQHLPNESPSKIGMEVDNGVMKLHLKQFHFNSTHLVIVVLIDLQ